MIGRAYNCSWDICFMGMKERAQKAQSDGDDKREQGGEVPPGMRQFGGGRDGRYGRWLCTLRLMPVSTSTKFKRHNAERQHVCKININYYGNTRTIIKRTDHRNLGSISFTTMLEKVAVRPGQPQRSPVHAQWHVILPPFKFSDNLVIEWVSIHLLHA